MNSFPDFIHGLLFMRITVSMTIVFATVAEIKAFGFFISLTNEIIVTDDMSAYMFVSKVTIFIFIDAFKQLRHSFFVISMHPVFVMRFEESNNFLDSLLVVHDYIDWSFFHVYIVIMGFESIIPELLCQFFKISDIFKILGKHRFVIEFTMFFKCLIE